MIETLLTAFYYAAAVGVISCLISESNLLSPVRKFLGWQLLYCPICLGFWLAIPAIAVSLMFYFVVVGFSNVWMLVILKTYEALDNISEDK